MKQGASGPTPLKHVSLLISKRWVQAVAIVMLFSFFVLGLLAYRTYTDQDARTGLTFLLVPEVAHSFTKIGLLSWLVSEGCINCGLDQRQINKGPNSPSQIQGIVFRCCPSGESPQRAVRSASPRQTPSLASEVALMRASCRPAIAHIFGSRANKKALHSLPPVLRCADAAR